MNKVVKIIGGAFLIFIGITMILSLMGIHLGGLFGLIVGAGLLYWGYSRWQERGEWSFGTIIIIALGTLILFGGLGGIISLLIGILLLYGGYRMITSKGKNRKVIEEDVDFDDSYRAKRKYDSFDDEFDRLMNK
ncbi:LiaF transmembrane domain-containing protein [Alkalihalobacillus sp. 1P02AB]|uniref:LiaF transmembrane domain-containing protein n=1 Tax=Alkalihalobacillus sp. 1P02AB TaxID=3132260 RepID=UPI0039A4958F